MKTHNQTMNKWNNLSWCYENLQTILWEKCVFVNMINIVNLGVEPHLSLGFVCYFYLWLLATIVACGF